MSEKRKRVKYTPDMAGRMYRFFLNYNEAGVPSFGKFAVSVGLTLEDLLKFRRHKSFDLAYLECLGIRRDYLIDGGLLKRFDPSFTKFLITLEDEATEREDDELVLRLEVKQ